MKIDPFLVVKDALSPLGVPVRNTVPPADRTQATFLVVTIEPASGPGARPGWVERVTVGLEAWVGDGSPESRKQRCVETAIDARDALFSAWQAARRTEHGAINHLPDLPWPSLIPSGLDGVWRSLLQVPVTIRK